MIGISINVNLPGSKYQHIHRDFKANNDGLIVSFGCQDISNKNGSINLLPLKRGMFYSTLFAFNFLRNQISLAQGNALIRWGSQLYGSSPNRTDIRRVMVGIVLIPPVNNLTGFIWDSSLKEGPRSNFFKSSFRKRFTLFLLQRRHFYSIKYIKLSFS
jgi:hypothetical protein